MGERRLRVGVSGEPAEIPLYEDQATRDEQYRAAERAGRPYLAVESYDGQFAVTYDLLPAGVELSAPVRKELATRVTQAVEDIVADSATPTTEVSKSIGTSLGSAGVFEREESARIVATVVAGLVLDEDNWVDASGPDSPSTDSLRKN